MISEIKQNEIKRVQEKLQQEDENSIAANKGNLHNNVTIQDDDPDLRTTLTENILLRQLNKELKQKNDLLLNTIELMKNIKPTCAETIKKSHLNLSKFLILKFLLKLIMLLTKMSTIKSMKF